MLKSTRTLGFVGCGQMATAIIGGLVNSGFIVPSNVVVYDHSIKQTETLQLKHSGIQVVQNNPSLVQQVDVVVLCVKPQYIKVVLKEVSQVLSPRHLIVSIAAGVPLSLIEDNCPDHGLNQRIARVMPNTPCLVGETASAWCANKNCTEEDSVFLSSMLKALGVSYQVQENQMDAVTGLSGSGPAYVFLMIEAMADGGVKAGLPRDIALKLAAQTVLGAGKMVLETGKHPGILKDEVTSAGGATIAAIHELEKGSFRGTVMSAVEASAKRSKELIPQ